MPGLRAMAGMLLVNVTALLPPASGETGISLELPLACIPGETCWVANYADADPSAAARDFRCRARTYDGHDGVDFAIRDLGVMAKGVPVVASAAGTVRHVRDGMADVAITDEASRKRIAGRECGNGLVIEHDGGWQTQYCHLRQGSIAVRAGERMEAGRTIGLVGLSGKTEFPHVHLTVRLDGQAVDPFTGQSLGQGCGQAGQALWRPGAVPPYEEVALYNAGFAAGKPDLEAIRKGQQENGPLPAMAPALTLWVDIFGVEKNDRLQFQIIGPDGNPVLLHEQVIDKTQARRFAFAGKKREAAAWGSGSYTGVVKLLRKVDGKDMSYNVTRTATVGN